jgi:hypothetical protein
MEIPLCIGRTTVPASANCSCYRSFDCGIPVPRVANPSKPTCCAFCCRYLCVEATQSQSLRSTSLTTAIGHIWVSLRSSRWSLSGPLRLPRRTSGWQVFDIIVQCDTASVELRHDSFSLSSSNATPPATSSANGNFRTTNARQVECFHVCKP